MAGHAAWAWREQRPDRTALPTSRMRPPLFPRVRLTGRTRNSPSSGVDRHFGDLQLMKLGVRLAASTIARILCDHDLGPAPRRPDSTWRKFIRAQASQIVATDFFSVDTVLLRRLYVLFFIELGHRRAWITGVTAHPTGICVTQRARNVAGDLVDAVVDVNFIVRDRDTKYVASFDEVFKSEGARSCEPHSGRRTRTLTRSGSSGRSDASAWIIFSSSTHDISSAFFGAMTGITTAIVRTRGFPRGIPAPQRRSPLAPRTPSQSVPAHARHVHRRDRLGGLIHEYELAA